MSIKMEDFVIEDVLKNTKGILSGKINHTGLHWFLDFNISSDNLLALTQQLRIMIYIMALYV